MAVVKGYAVTKRSAIVLMLLFTGIFALCICGRKEEPFDRYLFGNVSDHTSAGFSGYQKEISDIYGIAGRNNTGSFYCKGSVKSCAICVWDTADGGMAACDYATGTYVYTRRAVSYDALALILKNHIKNTREIE